MKRWSMYTAITFVLLCIAASVNLDNAVAKLNLTLSIAAFLYCAFRLTTSIEIED